MHDGCGGDVLALPGGHGHHNGLAAAQAHVLGLAFPHARLGGGLVGRQQLHILERAIAPVEQLQRLFCAGGFAGSAHDNDQQAAALWRCGRGAVGRGNQVVAGGGRVAGFQAIHAGVAKQQQIAIVAVGFGRAGVVVAFDGVVAGVLRKICQQAGRQQRHVARRGGVAFSRQPFGVAVAGVVHAQFFGGGVHLLHKGFLAAQ